MHTIDRLMDKLFGASKEWMTPTIRRRNLERRGWRFEEIEKNGQDLRGQGL